VHRGASDLGTSRPRGLGAALVAVALVALAAAIAPASARAGDRDCGDFATQAAAQDHFLALGGPAQDPDRLDADHDGIACESNQCPCNRTSTPGGGGAPSPDPTASPTPTPAPDPARRAAQITRVIDGDTVEVRLASRRRLTVRLIGIDTPETKRPGVPVECGARNASALMRRIAFRHGRGRRVTLVGDPSQDSTDRYGRTLAYVDARGTGDLGRRMLRAGWASVYVFGDPFARLSDYRDRSAAAQRASAGVWARCGGDFHRSAGSGAARGASRPRA
jgi:endonuclease YncB( thermonuclease family)